MKDVVLPDPSSGVRQKQTGVEVNKVVLVDTMVQSIRESDDEEASRPSRRLRFFSHSIQVRGQDLICRFISDCGFNPHPEHHS